MWAIEGFREAEKIRQKKFNGEAWLQGMYFYDGLCCAIKNALGSAGGSSAKYPSQPYSIDEEQRENDKAIKEENERLAAELYMRNMVRAGRSWKK